MLPVYKHNKHQVHTSKLGLLGGRIQTVEMGGRIYEVKKHKMKGLHIQPAHYAIGVDSLNASLPSVPEPLKEIASGFTPSHAYSHVANASSKQNTRKKLSQILRGGALAPL